MTRLVQSAELSSALLSDVHGGQDTCFHCGLPNPSEAPKLEVLGAARHFCCHGCHAVAETIVQAGLDNYYQHRTGVADAPAGETLVQDSSDYQRLEELLAIYDREAVKAGFVQSHGDLEEACLMLEGIHCAACVWLNERHIRKLNGVQSVQIDAITHRAQLVWDPEKQALSDILRAIRDIGYAAHPYDPHKNAEQLKARQLRSGERLLFAGVLGMFVMNFSLATYFLGESSTGILSGWEIGGRWASWVICLALLLYPARVFYVSAYAALRRGQVNMDVPIVLGLSAAFLGSTYATIVSKGEVYYEAIAMFIFLILLSRRWELKGRLFASKYLARLEKHRLKTAQRERADETLETVTMSELVHDDVVVVMPGETVPVDGRLLSAAGEFDESLLTGESLLQYRQCGDRVVAGSINGAQRIRLRIDGDNANSTLEAMHRLVLRGADQRPTQALLANQVASRFIIALLVVTMATAAYWLWQGSAEWLSHTISVLIVTCPCALALAIPVATSLASARLLESGVLPLDMSRLDVLAKADTVVFDKTGTLTEALPLVAGVAYVDGADHAEVRSVMYAMVVQSEHPLASAIRQHLALNISPSLTNRMNDGLEVDNQLGRGLQVEIAGVVYRLGSVTFVCQGAEMPLSLQANWQRWQAEGRQVVAFGSPGRVQALWAVNNHLRAGAESVVADLSQQGIQHFSMLSGDAVPSVARIAELVGIKDWRAAQTPEDKLAAVQALQGNHPATNTVWMVGDGMNDAPTLAAADVSVSVSSASDLAQLSSDFVLLGEDLHKLGLLRTVAQQTRRIVRQNLFWAIAYNVSMVPAAALGWVSPWMAALGMSMSSLLVIANALRLSKVADTRRGRTVSTMQKNQGVYAEIAGSETASTI